MSAREVGVECCVAYSLDASPICLHVHACIGLQIRCECGSLRASHSGAVHMDTSLKGKTLLNLGSHDLPSGSGALQLLQSNTNDRMDEHAANEWSAKSMLQAS